MNTTAPIILTEEQEKAVFAIKQWFEKGNLEFKLGGYAGTGKTTIIKQILLSFKNKNCNVAAFTGKAVNVLQRKGVPASTIHSLIYNVDKQGSQFVFTKKPKVEVKCDLIIIDESSMISTEIYKDLVSYGIKLLFVGDPGQLEPVGDNPNLMAVPDFVLTKIHRQAEKSPIIFWANEIRQGRGINHKSETEELFIRDKMIRTGDFFKNDQMICAKNLTRTSMNRTVRQSKRLEGPMTIGEKLIVLRNNPQFSVFNGMIVFVDKIVKEDRVDGRFDIWECEVHDEVNKKYTIPIWKEPFNSTFDAKNDKFVPKNVVQTTYGYVITCHKSQGSEWDKVLVYDEWIPPQVRDMKRWRYTAITRAAKQLTYCM